MKKTKKLLLILLALTLVFSLFACGGDDPCKEHIDENGDGKCDKCKEEMISVAEKVLLFDGGIPTFQIVIENSLDKDIRKIVDNYADAMEDIDTPVDVVEGTANNEIECEILIGDVKNRDAKYSYDKHSLGKDGYIFKIIDSKIIINAGSYDTLASAVDEFIEDILMFDEDTEDYGTLYMEPSQEILEVQDGYKITSIAIDGVDLKGYTIATNTSNRAYRTAAETLQDMIYDRSGYWLDIVTTDKATDKSIIIKSIDKVYGDESFHVYTNEKKQLIIDCAFENKFENAISSFVMTNITLSEGDLNFAGSVYKEDISFLTYEEFGAKGDGKTDDFEAIYNTHIEANKYGQSVKADQNATYYIKNTTITLSGTPTVVEIPIKTDVYWGKAEFTIDDREISIVPGADTKTMSNNDIFIIQSDYASYKLPPAQREAILAGGLRPGVTKLDISFDYPVMIIPANNQHNVYRRRGYGGASGSEMHEIIVLDKDGNIDPSTPVMFDYNNLTSVEVIRLDIKPITIDGGIFTTRSTNVNTIYTNSEGRKDVYGGYIARSINCNRSFTTIKNMEHYVTDEKTIDDQIENGKIVYVGACYTAFYYSEKANEVTYENCIMTGRRCYARPSDSLSTGTGGTYDLNGNKVNKLYFKNCQQINFWVTVDSATTEIRPAENRNVAGVHPSMETYSYDGKTVQMHWGIGGTNFCKNMEYIDSTLSRFDAHSGLYNGKIINSTVNYIAITGNGDFIVEDTEWYSSGTNPNGASIFHLRADYGSTWDGDITAKNLDAYVFTGGDTYLFLHTYNNWYYGYVSAMPNLSIDDLDIYDISTYEAVPAGRAVYMMQNSLNREPQMHLSTAKWVTAEYCYIDLDNDGLVDGTDIPYVKGEASNYSQGVSMPEGTAAHKKNLNPIKAPEYLKVINNDGVNGTGGYLFIIPDTHGSAPAADDVSNLPAGVDPDGGFFAFTKFYYGPGENDYFLGTHHASNSTFSFRSLN